MVIAKSVDGWQDDGNPASFRRWLGSVSRNVVIRFMARERRQAGGVGGSDVLSALGTVEAPADHEQIQRYRYELILWAAEQVRHDFLDSSWRAFWFTVIEQRSVEEVARELGVSPGSIYMSRSRIMSRIREKVAEVDEL